MTHPKISIQENELAAFCRRNQITQLALFGSVLSERFEPDSDVDVLVSFAPDAQIGFLAFGRIQRGLADLLQHSPSPPTETINGTKSYNPALPSIILSSIILGSIITDIKQGKHHEIQIPGPRT